MFFCDVMCCLRCGIVSAKKQQHRSRPGCRINLYKSNVGLRNKFVVPRARSFAFGRCGVCDGVLLLEE